tara:strand:+ start:99 stop:326 length:228 start_codon:yes stop_codon:yes gene_type:complete
MDISEISEKKEYTTSYENALLLYKNEIGNKKINNDLETEEYPMHPRLFYRLSNINGFNTINGKNYNEYLKIWKNR